MPSYVITGTSRGLGLGFVRALSADPTDSVFALVRSISNASQLQEFVAENKYENVHVLEADNDDYKAIQAAVKEVSKATGGSLDVLILNGALMNHERNGLTLDAYPTERLLEEDLLMFFKTNVLGPIHTVNAFLPLLQAGSAKKCIAIGSPVGNPKFCARTGFANVTGYGISKAGLNLAILKYAARFKEEGLIFVTVTPGLVRSRPGPKEDVDRLLAPNIARIKAVNPNFEGSISVEESVHDILALTSRVTIADTGSVVHRDGRDADEML